MSILKESTTSEDLKSRDKVLKYLDKKKIDPKIYQEIVTLYDTYFETRDEYFNLLDEIEQSGEDAKHYVLESLQIHDQLNPVLWDGKELKPEVLNKLIEIYEAFIDYIELPLNIVDVEIVGSNASYNYNEDSDLDLHIIVNSDVNYVEPTILRELYNSKKSSFNDNFNLSIYNIPIELYIEDVRDGNATNGRYSIIDDKWVLEPKHIDCEVPDVTQDVLNYQEKAMDVILSDDVEKIREFINLIYMMRKLGLEKDGECSEGNLIFKELRNNGTIQELKDSYYNLQSEKLSL